MGAPDTEASLSEGSPSYERDGPLWPFFSDGLRETFEYVLPVEFSWFWNFWKISLVQKSLTRACILAGAKWSCPLGSRIAGGGRGRRSLMRWKAMSHDFSLLFCILSLSFLMRSIESFFSSFLTMLLASSSHFLEVFDAREAEQAISTRQVADFVFFEDFFWSFAHILAMWKASLSSPIAPF